MNFTKEIKLRDFEFWSGAKETVSMLSGNEIELLERYFEDLEDEGFIWSDTQINDFFWFETDWIAKYLGFEDYDDLYDQRKQFLKSRYED